MHIQKSSENEILGYFRDVYPKHPGYGILSSFGYVYIRMLEVFWSFRQRPLTRYKGVLRNFLCDI